MGKIIALISNVTHKLINAEVRLFNPQLIAVLTTSFLGTSNSCTLMGIWWPCSDKIPTPLIFIWHSLSKRFLIIFPISVAHLGNALSLVL